MPSINVPRAGKMAKFAVRDDVFCTPSLARHARYSGALLVQHLSRNAKKKATP
jgi:hypothetical protein